jgi:diguanylate cyclase (GGDEF)-like protein
MPSPEKIPLLLVEDDVHIARFLERFLNRLGYEVDWVASAELAMERLKAQFFPLAFLDINLPGMSGLELCKEIRQLPDGEHCYIIVGTGEAGPDQLQNILSQGADDYIPKPYQPGELSIRMAVAGKRVAGIQALREAQSELNFLASHDPLTRLLNRRQLETSILQARQTANEGEDRSSLLLLDLDHFKEVNDICGHQMGDRILQEVSAILQNELPESAAIVRYGGDEFIGVLPGATPTQAVNLADRVLDRLNALDLPDIPAMIKPGASIGIAWINPSLPPEEIFKHADSACYRAKSQGKNRAEVYVEFDARLLQTDFSRKRQESSNIETMSGNYLRLFFQPVCDLQSGKLVFQESLLRFFGSPQNDAIQAAMFLSQINDRTYIRSIDHFVAEEVFLHLAESPHLTASINISAISIADWSFTENLRRLLERYEVDGSRLILEITETQIIKDTQMAKAVVQRIHELGIRIALDDFGTGFSSITSLRELQVDIVKLHGDMTRNILQESFNQVMFEAVTVMSRGIGFLTVAERIESKEELDFARDQGIHLGQGYLLGRPRETPYLQSDISSELFAFE